MVYTIKSNGDFEKRLTAAGKKLVLVDFYATWCGPCKDIEPTVRSIERKYSGDLVVLKVNVDKFDDLCSYYKVRSMPTFVFIRNKKKVGGFCGANETTLSRKVAKLV